MARELVSDEWGTWEITGPHSRVLVSGSETQKFHDKRVTTPAPPTALEVYKLEVAAATTLDELKAAILKRFS